MNDFRRTPGEIAVAVLITVMLLVAWFTMLYLTVRVAGWAWGGDH